MAPANYNLDCVMLNSKRDFTDIIEVLNWH